MVQVKGSRRPLTQRFSRDFAGRVKYSTLWPSRRDSPSDARRAMPTSADFWGSGNKGRLGIFRLLFAYSKPLGRPCQAELDGRFIMLVPGPPTVRNHGMNHGISLDVSSFQKLLEAAWVLQCERDRERSETHNRIAFFPISSDDES